MYILELKNKDNHSVQTDFIVDSFNQREVLHQRLKQADDTIKLSIPFSADIWNFINANKNIKAKITKDGEAYFTGYVRPDFNFGKIQRFQPIQIELINGTYITSFYEIEESIAYKDTTLGAIVSNLLERAEITNQDTSFLDEPIIFDIFEEGTTIKDALSQILFEYGYFWDFDKNGEFTVQKIYNKDVTPSVVLDGTNILEKVQVSKKEQEFDRVEVEYEHYEKFENLLLFQDNTGTKSNKGCFIELGHGKYLGQIEGETSYDITYDSEKGEVIWVDDASLSILYNGGVPQTTFINKNTKGNLSVYNPTKSTIYILLLEVLGTAYVKTIESATVKVGQEGKNKSIKSKYIHSKKAAENFAKMYYDWGKSCDYVISLQSKLNLDVGTIVEVNTAGKIVGRVIEKTTKLDGKPYTYKIEAIEEYELPEITSSILRKSSPIGTAARGTGILKINTAPTAYTTPVSGITPAYRISTDVVKTQSLVDEVYTGDILQYSYYQYQVILVADDYVYTAARTSIRGSVGATGATGAKGDTGDKGASVNTNLQSGNKDASDCNSYSAFANGVFERSNSTLTENCIYMADTANLVSAGKQYTISFEAKQNGKVATAEVYYFGNNFQTTGYITSKNFAPTTTWQKFSHTFTIASGAKLENQRIRFDNNGTKTDGVNAILYIRNVKLEEGGIATPFCYSVKDSIGAKGDTGATGQRGGRDLAITTAPSAYTTAVGGFTPSYRIALSTVKTQSGIDTVYVGDTLVYGVYRYPVGYVDSSYVYTSARTSVKGDKGDTGATGATGVTGASSRTIAYRINYSTFTAANDGEIYVCGYNSAGAQADVAGYVIVNGATHYIKGMLNSNVPMNGYVAAEIGGTSASPKEPFYAIFDWWSGKYYKMANSQTISGKTWSELFTEITNKSAYIVLGKVSSSTGDGALMFEETTPCLLSSIIEPEVNLTYQGVVATTTDMSASITPYKFSQDANGDWIKTILYNKTIKKWSFVFCMNATTPNSSTAAPVIKLFNGTWWSTIPIISPYYNSMQSMMAGDLPAIAGYYDTLGLAVPSICGTYIKTLTSNKAFINELFANDITVGNKISTPFTPTTSLRCYVEYANPSIANSWTTDLSSVYNSSGAKPGTSRYKIRFGHQVPGSSTRIPLEVSFTCQESVTSVAYAFSTVDSPYTVPSAWTTITKTSFPNTANISSNYKWLFIKEEFPTEGSPVVYAIPCYTTSTRSDGFEIKSDGSAIFTGKTRFEGGIGIVCDAKDVVINDGLLTISYHLPIDFSVYDALIFLESNNPSAEKALLYKFTCVQYTKYKKTAMYVFTTYNNTAEFGDLIEASVEADNVGYNSQQLPNGYINEAFSLLKKVVVKQKTTSLSMPSIRAVIIPYVE